MRFPNKSIKRRVRVKQRITCFCENAFEVEVPEEIDLDKSPQYLDEIQNGSFFSYTCPSCGKTHKPEFPLSVLWPSKKFRFEVFPELERGEFYRRKKPPENKTPLAFETIIGYPEMADRLAVIKDGFEPAAAEAIKYYLHLKAEEQYPDEEIDIWYYASDDSSLEFHVHGLREEEVAVMKIPLSLYQKTLDDYKAHPKKELFTALKVRGYLSVKNTMRPEELK
jgi:hypothetical protein